MRESAERRVTPEDVVESLRVFGMEHKMATVGELLRADPGRWTGDERRVRMDGLAGGYDCDDESMVLVLSCDQVCQVETKRKRPYLLGLGWFWSLFLLWDFGFDCQEACEIQCHKMMGWYDLQWVSISTSVDVTSIPLFRQQIDRIRHFDSNLSVESQCPSGGMSCHEMRWHIVTTVS